jgi:hypothetical protein
MTKNLSLDEITDSNKEILFDILGSKKIKSFVVSFNGDGDSGQIEQIDLKDKILGHIVEGSKVPQGYTSTGEVYKKDASVEEIIEHLCYKVLEYFHEGWEDGDGSYGEFLFDIKKRTVKLSLNERYIETNLHEHEF